MECGGFMFAAFLFFLFEMALLTFAFAGAQQGWYFKTYLT